MVAYKKPRKKWSWNLPRPPHITVSYLFICRAHQTRQSGSSLRVFCKYGKPWFVSLCWRRKPSTHPTTQSVIYLFVSGVVKSQRFSPVLVFLAGYFSMNKKLWQKNPYSNYISIITLSKSSLSDIYELSAPVWKSPLVNV